MGNFQKVWKPLVNRIVQRETQMTGFSNLGAVYYGYSLRWPDFWIWFKLQGCIRGCAALGIPRRNRQFSCQTSKMKLLALYYVDSGAQKWRHSGKKKMDAKLMSVMAIRNLWINKSKKCKTALKFRWNREVKQSKYEKSFYRIHRSKSNNRKFVSGGKRLKDSGIYTPGFCQAVFDVWQTAYHSRSSEFTSADLSLDNLWKETFKASSREED